MEKNEVLVTDMKERLNDILISVGWAEIAGTYFHRHSRWLYHKLDATDNDGFSAEEAELLKGALVDLSDRIRRAANNI